MESTTVKELTNLLNKSSRILIVSRGGKDGDVIGSMVALGQYLKHTGKTVDLLTLAAPDPRFAFLSHFEDIKTEAEKTDRFTIILDTSQIKPQKLSYDMQDDKLHIFITPKQGQFSPEQVSVATANLDADLVITLGLEDLADLGGLYERHTDLFYTKPVVNIDTRPSNEYFGEINIVEVKTKSLAEIIANLFNQISLLQGSNAADGSKQGEITEEIATALLAGMVHKTNSFQNINTTPKTLTIAAQLVAKGANQQEIVKHLFKTKPLKVLKLWGRVLARIQSMPEKKALWSIVTERDFEKTHTTPDYLPQVLDELDNTTEDRDIVVILYEEDRKIKGVVRARKHSSAIQMAEKFSGGLGNKHEAYFEIREIDFSKAEELLVSHLKSI